MSENEIRRNAKVICKTNSAAHILHNRMVFVRRRSMDPRFAHWIIGMTPYCDVRQLDV
jgi:hypothetical protein